MFDENTHTQALRVYVAGISVQYNVHYVYIVRDSIVGTCVWHVNYSERQLFSLFELCF